MLPFPENYTRQYRPAGAPRGPRSAKILIVGEAFGAEEEKAGAPFMGSSGQELERMLREAKIDLNECRFTNILNLRPPSNDFAAAFMFSSKKKASESDGVYHRGLYCKPIVLEGLEALEREVAATDPNIIVPVGNYALWGTSGNVGITKWRGSTLSSNLGGKRRKIVPTYHPAAILRTWEWRRIAVHDLRKVCREKGTPDVYEPPYEFYLRPTYSDVLDFIRELGARCANEVTKIAVDTETRNLQIACIGLADSPHRAICIPIQDITSEQQSYWTITEETEIIWELRKLLLHPNAYVVGQNFAYDQQYFARNYGFVPPLSDDTMLMQHVAFPGLPKSLDFISSMYRPHHTYWKDEGKTWDPKHMDEDSLWHYNCIDAVATYECQPALESVLSTFDLTEQYRERLITQSNAFQMMLRGVRSNMDAKLKLSSELAMALAQIRHWWMYVVGYDIFGKAGGVSAQKFKAFCYDYLKLPPKYSGTKGQRRLTADKNACKEWEETCEPIFRPLLAAIRHYRSIGVFKSSFADAKLDWDGRWRCSYNIAGTDTFRWSSSEDAFGFGANLQTIPKGDER